MIKFFKILLLSILFYNCTGTIDTTKQNTTGAGSSSSSTGNDSSILKPTLAMGANHTILLYNGKIKCFGYNGYGQLGIGSTSNIGDNSGEMITLRYIYELGDNIIQVAAGGFFSIALYDSGKIKTWGRNDLGQLGYDNAITYGDNQGEVFFLNYISFGEKIVNIAAGSHHTIALFTNGKIKCWGYNAQGQLGYGHTSTLGDGTGEITALDYVPITETISQIAAGEYHTVVLTSSYKVFAWGYNGYGQLGLGHSNIIGDTAGEISTLINVDIGIGTGENVIQVAAGSNHTVVLLNNGKAKAWGRNDLGQLGYGHTTQIGDNPGEMGIALPYVNMDYTVKIKKIAAGMNHTAALFENGKIRCWGYNAFGQLGYNHTTNIGNQLYNGNIFPDPLNDYVNLEGTAVDIFAGGDSTCAVMNDGKVYCWGKNDNGQLGSNYGNAAPYNLIGNDEYPAYAGQVTY